MLSQNETGLHIGTQQICIKQREKWTGNKNKKKMLEEEGTNRFPASSIKLYDHFQCSFHPRQKKTVIACSYMPLSHIQTGTKCIVVSAQYNDAIERA